MRLADTFAIVLLPDYCLLSAANVIKPLQDVLALDGREGEGISLWQLREKNVPGPIRAEALTGPVVASHLVLIGGNRASWPDEDQAAWLETMSAKAEWVMATGSASAWLVSSGRLKQGKVSAPELLLDPARVSPGIRLSSDLFSIEGKLTTCRAGTAPLDALLFWLRRWLGAEAAQSLAHGWVQERVGGTPARVRRLPDRQAVQEAPLLMEAIRLMEANVEEPLTTDDLSGHLGISRRQLERWFRKYLDTVPSRYYKEIRLEAAREKVRATRLPLAEIAVACGFSSAAHFATAYRDRYGCTPSQDREQVSGEKI